MLAVFTLSFQTLAPCKSKMCSFTRYTTTKPNQNNVRFGLLEDSFTINGLMKISIANNDKSQG